MPALTGTDSVDCKPHESSLQPRLARLRQLPEKISSAVSKPAWLQVVTVSVPATPAL